MKARRRPRKPERAAPPRRRIGFAPEAERLRPTPCDEREYEGTVGGDMVEQTEDYA